MSMNARFPGTCINCRRSFSAGTPIEWKKGRGSWHVTCPTTNAASGVVVPSTAMVTFEAAPFEAEEKRPPCKREAFYAQLPRCIGETRMFTRRPPRVRGNPIDDRAEPGLYTIVGTGRTWYESAADNEDMGDMSSPGWHVVLYLRKATPEEQADYERETLGAAIPGIFEAMVRMLARNAKERAKKAMDEAAARPGWGRVEVWQWDALGSDVLNARRETKTTAWSETRSGHSYIASFTYGGQTLWESYSYVYDWDQPTVIVAPMSIVIRASLAQWASSFGYEIQRAARRMAERKADRPARAA